MTHESELDINQDPNFIAFQEALKSGLFEAMQPGTWVAYHEGALVGSDVDQTKLFQELHQAGVEGFLYKQVGVPEHVYKIRGPRLHRP